MISEDDLPFEEQELARALALVYPVEYAQRTAREIAANAATMHTRAAAEAAIARGSTEPTEVNWETLVVPNEWFALLAALDPTLSTRVEQWRHRQRAPRLASRAASAMYRRGLSPRDPPTPEVLEEVAAEDAAVEAEWAATRARVDIALALPHAERQRLALAALDRERHEDAEWRPQVSEPIPDESMGIGERLS